MSVNCHFEGLSHMLISLLCQGVEPEWPDPLHHLWVHGATGSPLFCPSGSTTFWDGRGQGGWRYLPRGGATGSQWSGAEHECSRDRTDIQQRSNKRAQGPGDQRGVQRNKLYELCTGWPDPMSIHRWAPHCGSTPMFFHSLHVGRLQKSFRYIYINVSHLI